MAYLPKGEITNKTRIEWTDYTTNPLGQGCAHGCWFCFARRGSRRNYYMHLALYQKGKRKDPPCEMCRDFRPHFHPERLKDPWKVKTPSKIFVCSTSDPFASWTQHEWRNAILDSIYNCPIKHTFQLLTKNPENIPKGYVFPENVWVGTTVTMEHGDWRNIDEIKTINARIKFASFEPLLGLLPDDICLNGLQWVIIGKLTGSRKVKLDPYWVERIKIEAISHNIPVFIKNNVGWPNKIQDFPT